MPQVIKFIQKQVLAGDNSVSVAHYSDIYDVSGYTEIVAECRCYGFNGTGTITAELETASDSRFDDGVWSALGSTISVSGLQAGTGVFNDPLRYVRAKVTVPADVYATLCFEGVAREGT